jgi:hypothetical protein
MSIVAGVLQDTQNSFLRQIQVTRIKIALNRRRFNDITMIRTKMVDVPTELKSGALENTCQGLVYASLFYAFLI